MTTYDFSYGTNNVNNPSQFVIPTGMGVAPTGLDASSFAYGPLNTGGMGGVTPTMGAGAGTLSGAAPAGMGLGGFGMNLPSLQLGLGALGTGFNIYGGLKALGLAQDQFKLQKDMAQKNYANSVANYNTSLEDRATSRASYTGQSAADTQAYIAAHKLS